MCVPQMTEEGGQLEALNEGYNCIIVDEVHEAVLASEKSQIDRSFGVYLADYFPERKAVVTGITFTNGWIVDTTGKQCRG